MSQTVQDRNSMQGASFCCFTEGMAGMSRDLARDVPGSETRKAADVSKKDVWDFQVFSQTFFELRFSLGTERKDVKNLNSQTWPGTPRRPPPRHPRPSYKHYTQETLG